MRINIQPYQRIDKAEWNAFVSTSKNKHFFFFREFMDYHNDKFIDSSLIIRNEKDKIIALFPANIRSNMIYSHQGLTFGGFITDKKMHVQLMLDIFSEVINFFRGFGIIKIIYKVIPYIYHAHPAQEDLYALFIHHGKLIRRDVSSSICMSSKISYSKGRKWGVNAARKQGVYCGKFNNASEAWPLIREILLHQHNAQPVHTEQEIDLLQMEFPNNIQAYYAALNNQVIAVAVLFITDQVCHTQYLAVGEVGRRVSALDYLIDHIIQLYSSTCHYFDFGISNENNGLYLNEGLISQKEGFGARAVIHDFYELSV
ncbi:GNAT family N-acetyltransferase [Wohlfahrtiimonas chitiniclastica]|uniref:GNAT family N-acetyltransferase n=1 Tax=Wohlfahrtiimonas chitiniclastica TaxID=400946 RepID=UPI001BD0DCB5|nr:GNAT family N-acetyltransferase [Wohlfahrtiimonas chitiniclastica]MBS7820813.1 GNAT family N-acetyltransferase [Wohlfahrtiimonas chitiniclastica]MBS7838741.1 GNAT family N-acetyltransferase [Wohlfahrtiimonas chitiniclastica]